MSIKNLRSILNRISAQAPQINIDPDTCNCIKKCDYDDMTCALDCLLLSTELENYTTYLDNCIMGTYNKSHCKCVNACTKNGYDSPQAKDCVRGCLTRFHVPLGKQEFWVKECKKP